MRIVIAGEREDTGRFVASQAAETLRSVLSRKNHCNLVVATGSSQFQVLDNLVEQPGIDWRRVHGFHLDEYLGLPHTHSASFCGYLSQRFVSKVPLASFQYLDGTLPPEELLRQATQAIEGKTIDLLLCGIGENGHLAFNDPPADFQTDAPYQIVKLDEACRKQQVGEGWFDSLSDVPGEAISMSIRQIMRAEQILCTVPDRRKATAVKRSVEGPVDPQTPASILQQHSQATLVIDSAAASLLSPESLESCQQLDKTSN